MAKTTLKLTFRKSPAVFTEILGEIVEGENVTIIEKGSKWAKINYKGVEGYVAAKYLSDSSPIPTPAPLPPVKAIDEPVDRVIGTGVSSGVITSVSRWNTASSEADVDNAIDDLSDGPESIEDDNDKNNYSSGGYGDDTRTLQTKPPRKPKK